MKNFKLVEDICGLERAPGGSVGDRLAREQDQEERNQVGNSSPCNRQEIQDGNREDQLGPRAIWGTIHVTQWPLELHELSPKWLWGTIHVTPGATEFGEK